MQLVDQPDRLTWFIRLTSFVLIVTVLRVAQEVLVPVAFAALLAFLLSPLVVRLQRSGLPKAVSIVATVTFAFCVIGGIGWLLMTQAMSLAKDLPNYEQNLQRKIAELKRPHAPEGVKRMVGMVENLRRELEAESPDKPVTPAAENETRPVPVEVRPSEPTAWQVAREVVKPILRPLGTTVIVIVFVIAMLFQRDDLRDRIIRVCSGGRLNVATQAIDDAARRVSRYLGMQLVVNALYGIPLGIGLWFIGIPNAPLWGLLATLLRFIPFLGPWIAAIFPLTVSIAVDPGWTMFLYTLAFIVVLELISNNLVELVLYGASTGISNVALLVAAVFWTWCWGPAGLVLSTPLTVCLLVLGNYVPGMSVFGTLLGSKPVLDPPAQFYQRMLSMEPDEMFDVASAYIEQHSVEDFYENVFVPALIMAEADRHTGSLPEVRQRFIAQASIDLVEEFERKDEAARDEVSRDNGNGSVEADQPMPPTVLIVPARDEADQVVGRILVHMLQRRGIAAELSTAGARLEETFAAAARCETRVLLVSALPPSAIGAARQKVRHIRGRYPGASVIVGVWHHRAGQGEVSSRLGPARPHATVITLRGAIEEVEKTLTKTAAATFGSAHVDRPLTKPTAKTEGKVKE